MTPPSSAIDDDELTSRFGWEGDDGLGDRLIDRILRGEKTATCCPLSLYGDDEVARIRGSVGRVVTVTDKHGEARCRILVVDVYEVPFGEPDARLLEGEGFAGDPAGFQRAHSNVWRDLLDEETLTAETVLLVECFRLVDDGDLSGSCAR